MLRRTWRPRYFVFGAALCDCLTDVESQPIPAGWTVTGFFLNDAPELFETLVGNRGCKPLLAEVELVLAGSLSFFFHLPAKQPLVVAGGLIRHKFLSLASHTKRRNGGRIRMYDDAIVPKDHTKHPLKIIHFADIDEKRHFSGLS
jgi:hypothetical protein